MTGLWLAWSLSVAVMASETAVEPIEVAVEAPDGIVGLPGEPVTEPETLKARTRIVGLQIRCPVCQGLSVADSSSDAAVAMSNRVRELVAAGYTDTQILDYFADRYGDFILLAPPKEGLHWLLWAGPLVAVTGGLVWLLARTRRTGSSSPAAAVAIEESSADEDSYRARILAELKD